MTSSELSHGTPVYRFSSPLKDGVILSRPNRFIMLVDIGGETLRCHCPTTGRLGDLSVAGLPCLYSSSHSATRKTAHTVEAIATAAEAGSWVGINQTAANRYFEFFLRNGALSRMAKGEVRREVRLGRSRIDFLVGQTYIEVKTPLIVLPAGENLQRVRTSRFDSFDRLIRHMGELRRALAKGNKAVITLCYLYAAKPFMPPARNRTNSRILAAARRAEKAGVERWQVNMKIDKDGVSLIRYFRSRPYARRHSPTYIPDPHEILSGGAMNLVRCCSSSQIKAVIRGRLRTGSPCPKSSGQSPSDSQETHSG